MIVLQHRIQRAYSHSQSLMVRSASVCRQRGGARGSYVRRREMFIAQAEPRSFFAAGYLDRKNDTLRFRSSVDMGG